MRSSRCFAVGAAFALVLSIPASAGESEPDLDPLRFFEGKTESVSTLKLMMKKPFRTHALGTGTILGDGSLDLVQRVEGEGPTKTRRWRMRRSGDGHFTGTMTEAVGPVEVREIDGRYRFRFRMKGNMSVEQWLAPHSSGRSASNRVTIRKFGIKVGSSEGVVRKIG